MIVPFWKLVPWKKWFIEHKHTTTNETYNKFLRHIELQLRISKPSLRGFQNLVTGKESLEKLTYIY